MSYELLIVPNYVIEIINNNSNMPKSTKRSLRYRRVYMYRWMDGHRDRQTDGPTLNVEMLNF